MTGRESSRGFFGIGIYAAKHECNIGSLWRTARAFKASFIFTIGKQYSYQKSDTCKAYKSCPLFHFKNFDDFLTSKPKETILIGVELNKESHILNNYIHPERAIYLLGAEDRGIPQEILSKCNQKIKIQSLTFESLNVSIAGGIILYDRFIKQQ